ncbi:hypothetical protein BDZ94DRAFT_1205685, partial [Collybia nuda]
MRQKTQSHDDNRLRTALSNMRYGGCTSSDLAFLNSRVVGKTSNKPNLASSKFRNVSVITAWNAQKDRINELGSARFAKDTGQALTHFYSVDNIAPVTDSMKKSKRGAEKRQAFPAIQELDLDTKKALWNATPASSEHFPGKLSLCIGMPVMIRNNDATELCITKGQEGTVYGWTSSSGPDGQIILDTVFVKLIDPPKTVNIKGLPENVVPLSRSIDKVFCGLPNDTTIYITREQVQ